MTLSQASVMKLYNTVMDDVIAGVRDCFLDDGVDEQVLQELRSLWKAKLTASGAMDPPVPDRVDLPPPPPILQNFQKANGAAAKRAAAAHHEPQQSSSRQPLQESVPLSLPTPTQSAGLPIAVPPNVNNNRVPVQLTLPAQPGVPGSQPRVFTIQIPASALNGQQLHQVLTGPVISATLSLPPALAATLLQQHINSVLAGHESGDGGGGAAGGGGKVQHRGGLDGADDSSDEEVSGGEGGGASDAAPADEDEDEDEEDEAEEEEEENEGDAEGDLGAEEEPLNSGDDVSDEEPGDMFDTENVVVCQYDKITRSRNRWKFYLKDGIMNLAGKDFVFQKANGDAEW